MERTRCGGMARRTRRRRQCREPRREHTAGRSARVLTRKRGGSGRNARRIETPRRRLRPALLRCKSQDVIGQRCRIGPAGNRAPNALSNETVDDLKLCRAEAGADKMLTFAAFAFAYAYAARSWSCERRVVVRLEAITRGFEVRCISPRSVASPAISTTLATAPRQCDPPFRSGIAVHLARLRQTLLECRRTSVHRIGRRLLRQRDMRELLRDPRMRVAWPPEFSMPCRSEDGRLRVRRGLLQPETTPLRHRISVKRQLRREPAASARPNP